MKSSKNNINNHRLYLKTLKGLRKLIAESYSAGGWLPASRKACEMFKVNRKTYCKALQCLEQDAVARAYPQKGHYVNPEFLRINKIGIIIGDAGDSPFFEADEILCSIFNIIRENKYNAQLIQAAELDNVLDKALIHGVKGLIWLFPPESIFPNIQNMHNSSELPIMILSLSNSNKMKLQNTACVVLSSAEGLKKNVNFFIERKHKKVAIVSNIGTMEACKNKYLTLFKKGNIEPLFIFNDVRGKVADLTPLSTDSTITGMIIDGGAREDYYILDALSKLKTHSLTDICVHYTEHLEKTCAMYPNINVTAIGSSDIGVLGNISANIMMDHLEHGKELRSEKVDCYNLQYK